MDPTVAQQFSAQLVAMAQGALASHNAYLATLDRVYLEQYTAQQAPTPQRVADLNTASHAPTPQPFVVPNFVTPSGGVAH